MENINKLIDHTLLKAFATKDDIKKLCDEAIQYDFKSVCVNPANVKLASELLKDSDVLVCTVIGFPLGANTIETKIFETVDSIINGADEIDMVINVGWLKDKKYDEIFNEINEIKDACNGKILKVIIETCLLTNEEKIKMCEIVSNSNADFIKTSTGFSTAGATKEDIELFSKHTTNGKKIKAAGGIASIEDAEDFIKLGASRLGTSRIVKIVKNEQGSGY